MARMPVDERRARLVDAAISVMCRDGVAKTTTRSIVAEAGMQVGVFHYCFRSKEELMRQVRTTINTQSLEAVVGVMGSTTDPEELLRRAVAAYWEHVEAQPEQHQLTYELTHYSLRQPGELAAARAQYDQYIAGIRGFLDTVARLGNLTWSTPVDVLARLVLAVLEGVTFQWLVDRDSAMAHEVLGEVVDRLHREAGLSIGR